MPSPARANLPRSKLRNAVRDGVVAAREAEVHGEGAELAPDIAVIGVNRALDALGEVISGAVLADRDRDV